MSIEDLFEAIKARARERFDLQTSGAEIENSISLAPEQLVDCQVLRLRRSRNEQAGWRTFLVAAIKSADHMPTVNRWVAEVRDSLSEPGTADLYLFLLIDTISRNVGADIESSDLFCRKFVMRQDECAEEFLDRTFLTQVFSQAEGMVFSDPLQSALSLTAECHPWFSAMQQTAWRGALLSGKPGSDIADDLLSQVYGVGIP